MLIIWPSQLIKKQNSRHRAGKMLSKTAHYSSQWKLSEELEWIPEKWQREGNLHEGRCTRHSPPLLGENSYHSKKRDCRKYSSQSAVVWDRSLFSRGEELLSSVTRYEGLCAVSRVAGWPKRMKVASIMAPHTFISSLPFLYISFYFKDFGSTRLSCWRQIFKSMPEVRNTCPKHGELEIQKWNEKAVCWEDGLKKRQPPVYTLQGAFLKSQFSLLMPGQVPFSHRHLTWLLGTLLLPLRRNTAQMKIQHSGDRGKERKMG